MPSLNLYSRVSDVIFASMADGKAGERSAVYRRGRVRMIIKTKCEAMHFLLINSLQLKRRTWV